jgi:hypothetical protein
LFLVWTNLHGAVILGLIAVGAVVAVTLLSERKLPRSLAITAAGCFLATCISPIGWRLWPFILESTERSKINRLIEWLPPGASPSLWPFWALATALLFVTLRRWRQLDRPGLRLVAIALAVLPLAVRSVRNVSVFLLIGIPALTAVLAAGRIARRRKPARENERINGAVFTAGAAIALIIVALAWIRPPAKLGWAPMSAAAQRAIRQCPAPIYNTYGQGGEIIWFVPEHRVFIDNRQDPFPTDVLRANRALEFEGAYGALFEQYGIRCAIVPPASLIAGKLRADPAWRTTFEDPRWLILVKSQRP